MAFPSRALPFCLALALSFASRSAGAQGNYHSVPLGGRAALMGNTGVALGVDGAAPFLNPATIVQIADRRLAFSARFFRYSRTNIDNWYQPGPVDTARFGPIDISNSRVSEGDLDTLPDSTCYFFGGGTDDMRPPSGTQQFGLCLAKIEETEVSLTELDFEASSGGSRILQSNTFEEKWSHRNVGPSWALQLTRDLAVGASLFIARTSYDSEIGITNTVVSATGSMARANYVLETDAYSWDLVALVGGTFRASRVLTLGLSLRTPTLAHFGGSITASELDGFSDATVSSRFWSGTGDFVGRPPLRLAGGIAAELDRLRVELDGYYHAGSDEYARANIRRQTVNSVGGAATISRDQLALLESADPVFNLGLGAEWFVSRDLGLLAGVASDFSGLPKLDADRPGLFRSRENALHASLGIASYSRAGNLVLGLRGDYARGEVLVVNTFQAPAQPAVVDRDSVGLVLILAGQLSLVDDAAQDVGDAVDGDAPEPADEPRPVRAPVNE